MELYKAHRPKRLEDVVGQEAACSVLSGYLAKNNLPHFILFTGPSGTGKTTIARILCRKLRVGKADFKELNCADTRGIDTVRDIRERQSLSPIAGPCRMWLLDEVQNLTKDAQSAFLKMLEETPSHVYFIWATTDPQKLLPTVKTRATEVVCKALSAATLRALCLKVATAEGKPIKGDVADKLAEAAEGSARKALVLLDQIIDIDGEDEQLAAINTFESRAQGIELARTLFNERATWQTVAKILKDLKDEDPEGLRRLVMGYASAILCNGKASKRAFNIIDEFKEPYYNCGFPGLVASCYAVVHSK